MPRKPKTAEAVIDVVPDDLPSEVALTQPSLTLAAQVERNVALIPTPTLVPFFCRADALIKWLEGLKNTVKKEFLEHRLKEAAPCGEQGQHRLFDFGDFKLKFEQRIKWTLNTPRAHKLIEKKKLGADAYDLVIEGGVAELQNFLWKYRKEVSRMGLAIREEINPEKLQALVTQKKIAVEEYESLFDKGEPAYAVKVEK
jgi:hypothetical protein